jgi:hypothetical protein
MWDLWWTKCHWSRFAASNSVSPANSHSTSCSTIITTYHLGLVQQAKTVAAAPNGLAPGERKKLGLACIQILANSGLASGFRVLSILTAYFCNQKEPHQKLMKEATSQGIHYTKFKPNLLDLRFPRR